MHSAVHSAVLLLAAVASATVVQHSVRAVSNPPPDPCNPVKDDGFYLSLFNASGPALCLDGSSAGYYLREGDTKRWIIELEGEC